MNNTYQQTTIGGYKVSVFKGYDGTQLFITDADGNQIYAHRVSGDPMEIAREVIEREMPQAVAAPVQTKQASNLAICLTDRKDEFKQALKRGLSNQFSVYAGWDKDVFFVVNLTNKSEYKVEFETVEGKIFSSCECKDFLFKKRICKHISEVLQEQFFGHSLSV